MTALAALHPPLDGAGEEEGLRSAWPLLAILCIEAGLFVWMAPRGLDFTDESYYLLSFLHWHEFSATATFFGAYFEWPFRLFGQHVAWIRIFGMVLLVASGGFFTWRAMAFDRGELPERRAAILPFALCGMVSALFYYSYGTTLRVPSYNLLVLFCMLTATGLLLYLVDGAGARRRRCAAALGYGLVLGACALGKATSAVAMLVFHAAFVLCFNRGTRTLELAAIALLGVALNFLALQLLQPQWFQVLRRGVAFTVTLDGRYASIPVVGLWDSVLHGAARLLPAVLIAAAAFVVIVKRWGTARPTLLSWLVVLLVLGVTLTIQLQGYGKSWWALLVIAAGLLWLVARLCGQPVPVSARQRVELGLSILLFALPIAYSIGTNGSLPAHTQMATVFGAVALMLPLRRLLALGLIRPGALTVSLCVLCVPTLVSEARSLADPSFTYRLRDGVMEQRWPVSLGFGGDTLMVDATTRDSVEALVATMREAGYRAGEPLLDVTGDGPGLVYALGGQPPGVGWLIGGYAGSEQVAARVLDTVPGATLRRTWIISTDGNPRSLKTWRRLLAERAGESSHMLAGTVPYRAQYRWVGAPATPVTLSLWKPAASPLSSMPNKTP